jgi:hypothetical protein
LDVSWFKTSFGRKGLTDIDKRLVRDSDIKVENPRLSGPICSDGTDVVLDSGSCLPMQIVAKPLGSQQENAAKPNTNTIGCISERAIAQLAFY